MFEGRLDPEYFRDLSTTISHNLSLFDAIVRISCISMADRVLLVAMQRRIIQSSNVALNLIHWAEYNDAAIILRSIIEGSARLCYIINDASHIEHRIQLFTHAHYLSFLERDDRDIDAQRNFFRRHGAPENEISRVFPPLLTEKNKLALRDLSKEEKTEANKVFQIYTCLQEAFGENLNDFSALMKEYAFGSHISHYDFAGIQMSSDLPITGGPFSASQMSILERKYIFFLVLLSRLRANLICRISGDELPLPIQAEVIAVRRFLHPNSS